MKSPFPGMDPYIEASGLWADFHDDLIAEIKRALTAVLPDRYYAQIGHRSYVVFATDLGLQTRPFFPDVAVEGEHFREMFLNIYEAEPKKRLITSIEVLSPANK